jgi:hypothetical protein
MVNLESLPAIPFANRYSLPRSSGVYFAVSRKGKVLYIGKAINLRNRLTRHEHASLFDYMGGVRLAYLEMDDAQCREIEKACIVHFKPKLNINDVPKLKPKCKLHVPVVTRGMKKGIEKMLTVSEVATRLGESERNIRNWAKQKVLPGAQLKDSPRGPYWEIPESDLKGFEKPVRGRPVTKKDAKPSPARKAKAN